MFKVVGKNFARLEQGVGHGADEGHDGQVEEAQMDTEDVIHQTVVLVGRAAKKVHLWVKLKLVKTFFVAKMSFNTCSSLLLLYILTSIWVVITLLVHEKFLNYHKCKKTSFFFTFLLS